MAQLYVRDVPVLRPPGDADLLQVLWCPFDHNAALQPWPETALYWWTADWVTDILTTPPEPIAVQDEYYVPEPCELHPEQVTEYPDSWELSPDLRELLRQRLTRQAAGIDPDGEYGTSEEELFYRWELSIAPGWKAGGRPKWGVTDPVRQFCPACGTSMEPLLTIASVEWGAPGWIPREDQARAGRAWGGVPAPHHPTMVHIGRTYDLQLYACPASSDHPYTELMQ